MSRPTDNARYEQANKWMADTFGEGMRSYLTNQTEAPITRAVKDVAAVLSKSQVRESLTAWRAEDARSNAGANPIITVAGILALLLLHMRLGRVPHISAMTVTLHQLNEHNRFALGLTHTVDHEKSYDRIWAALQRLILLVDEFYVPDNAPRSRHTVLTAAEYRELVTLRDPQRCQRNRERMHLMANELLEGTLRLLPAEVLARWEGNVAGDATMLEMLGKKGNPSSKTMDYDRFTVNPDAGMYARPGNHSGFSKEDAKVLAKTGMKVPRAQLKNTTWAVEFEIAHMVRNITGKKNEFPSLIASLGFHIPGAITGAGAAMLESIVSRGHKINYAIFDRA